MSNNIKHPNILFVNLFALPFKFIEEKFTKKTSMSETLAMPLGILYLSSYLKANNQLGKVGLLDYPLSIENITDYLDVKDYILGEAKKQVKFKPDIICISLMFSASYPFYKLTAELLKTLWPEVIIVVGGIHATNCVKALLTTTKVDYVLCGEGEIALSEMVKQHKEGRPIQVKGLYSKDDICQSKSLELAEQIENLDSLPFPDWGLLDMERYSTALGRRRPMGKSAKKKVAAIMTTRGCPFRCTFCSAHTVHGRRVRSHSVENIVQNVKALYQKYGITLFTPEDDLFTADPKRLLSVLKGIRDLNIPSLELQFPNNLHVNTTTEEVIDALIECGTNIFTFAVESGSDYVQKNIIKKFCNLEKARALVKLCHEKGAIARCCFVIGFPGETKELLEETYQYMKDLNADWCVISIATPLIGSEMYEQFLERGDIQDNEEAWAKSFFTERDFDTEEITAAELNEFRYRINLDVNFVNNVNLRNGNFDRAISLFDDILFAYPFHIFAYYGLYLAYKGKKNMEKAEEMVKKMRQLIAKDKRAKEMYEKYGDLLPFHSKAPNQKGAASLRERILEILHKSGASHIGPCLSMIEILLAVYKSVNLEKIKNKKDDRERVIVSKGHSAAALYTVLNHFGLLKDEELETYHKDGSLLGGHVTFTVSGVEHSTGALGHGLSVAVGIGIGLRNKKIDSRVYVIVGDGELHEGSNWEALQFTTHCKLNNLCLLVDYNKLSGVGRTNDCCNLEPLKKKLESFGFETFEVQGHNQEEIYATIQKTKNFKKPVAIICHTIKGKGVSFMENNNVWQYRPLNEEDYKKAIFEIRGDK